MLSRHRKYRKRAPLNWFGHSERVSDVFLFEFDFNSIYCAPQLHFCDDNQRCRCGFDQFPILPSSRSYRQRVGSNDTFARGKFVSQLDKQSRTRDGMRPVSDAECQLAESGIVCTWLGVGNNIRVWLSDTWLALAAIRIRVCTAIDRICRITITQWIQFGNHRYSFSDSIAESREINRIWSRKLLKWHAFKMPVD